MNAPDTLIIGRIEPPNLNLVPHFIPRGLGDVRIFIAVCEIMRWEKLDEICKEFDIPICGRAKH